MRAELAAAARPAGRDHVYVTHDQTEAMTLGDRVCVMLDGVIQQVDTPRPPVSRSPPTRSSPASSARPR